MNVRHAVLASPLGELTATAADDTLTGIYFPDHRHPPRPTGLGTRVEGAVDPVLRAVGNQLDEYFRGRRQVFDLPLAPRGTAFQARVWNLLRGIEFGSTTTYGALAAQVGGPPMARAVGAAVGRNPLSIVVPCHRVVGIAGALTGFAGGIDRKRQLLDLEGVGDRLLF